MSTSTKIQAKDLTKEPPTSPRMADKARADIAGTIGDYHTDCPLDHMLLDWKEVDYAGVRKALEEGATDEEIANYLDTHGTLKTREEVRAWSDSMDKSTMHGHPEKGSWFDAECQKLGLDGARTTLFEWLEADDRTTYLK